MQIASWNVNGLRSFADGISGILSTLSVDILCLQETKLTRDVLSEELAIVPDHSSYFSFSRSAKGYSGVAIYCKDECCPIAVEEGLTDLTTASNRATSIGHYANNNDDDRRVDNEGRVLISEFVFERVDTSTKLCVCLINVYCPRCDVDNVDDRFDYKQRFQSALRARIDALIAAGKHIILVGDLNIARERIDHYDHRSMSDFDTQPHRCWLRELLYDRDRNANGILVDLFRLFHSNQSSAYTCWRSQMNMRSRNFGTRIDYIIADRELVSMRIFDDCFHRYDIVGSDHCPIVCRLRDNVRVVAAMTTPMLSTKYMHEFRGKQMKISMYLVEKKEHDTIASRQLKRRKTAIQQKAITDFFDRRKMTKVDNQNDADRLSTMKSTVLSNNK